ncbi:MAG: HlyD family efflux transporter periplasmic adaptor subunit [Clostridiales bacterium]|nr:HlyD family efflux transporter periplasmic adaptor subunit [Clostridiales bacterium]
MAEIIRKLRKKKWVIPVIIIGIAAVAIYFGTTAVRTSRLGVPNYQVKTASAERGTIELTVAGTGSLEAADSVNVQIPSILSVADMKVALGDQVKAGDVLATLDAGALQSSISQVQSDITAIDDQINTAKNSSAEATINAPVAGRVKAIAAAPDDDVTNTMVQDGYLVELSVDGRMKANIQSGSDPGAGSAVIVTLSDGSRINGTILSSGPSSFVVTTTDNGPAPGEQVSVQTNGGEELGSGTLEISTPLNVVGNGGTVKSVNVSLNAGVSQGQTLVTLKDSVSVLQYQELAQKRIAYANLLQLLLKYEETNSIVAETGGSVTAIPSGQQPGSANSPQVDINNLLNNLPLSLGSGMGPAAIAQSYGSADAPVFTYASASHNKPGQRTGFTFVSDAGPVSDRGSGSSTGSAPDTGPGSAASVPLASPPDPVTEIVGVIAVPVTQPVLGGTPQVTIPSGTGYTGTVTWSPVAAFFGPGTVYTAGVTLKADPGYRFADTINATVAGATVSDFSVSPEAEQNTVTLKAAFPATAALPAGVDLNQYINSAVQKNLQDSLNQSVNDAVNSAINGIANNDALQNSLNNSLNGAIDSAVSGIGNVPITIDGSSLFPSTGSASTSTAMTTLCTITPGKSFTLTAGINESDIFSVKAGQKANIVMDAMLNNIFSGEVSKVSTVGTSQSGVTAYPVTVKLDAAKTPLLSGMNATANIVTEIKENVLTIPMDALQEQGDQEYVYLYDSSQPPRQRNGQPVGTRQAVTTGISDGVNVEVTSGLKKGEAIVYTVAESNSLQDAFIAMGGARNGRGGTQSGGAAGTANTSSPNSAGNASP